jgi:predicted GNAT family acetyltransferase
LGDIWIRRVSKDDLAVLLRMIAEMNEQERKFLVISKKLALIKSNIRSERHIHVLESKLGVHGFIRESGRPRNSSMIEELYIEPEFRQKGYAMRLVVMLQGMFDRLEAKSFSNNHGMNNLFIKLGFENDDPSPQKRIFKWSWTNARQ